MSKIEISDDTMTTAVKAYMRGCGADGVNTTGLRAAIAAALPLIVADTIARQAAVIARVEALADQVCTAVENIGLCWEACVDVDAEIQKAETLARQLRQGLKGDSNDK